MKRQRKARPRRRPGAVTAIGAHSITVTLDPAERARRLAPLLTDRQRAKDSFEILNQVSNKFAIGAFSM